MPNHVSEAPIDTPECVGTNVVRTETVGQLYKKRRILAKSIMLYPLAFVLLIATSDRLREGIPYRPSPTLDGILQWCAIFWPIICAFLLPLACGFALYCWPFSKRLTVAAVVSVLPINGAAIFTVFGLLFSSVCRLF